MVVFDIGGGKLLCLLGQWMWGGSIFHPSGAAERFPADDFSVSYIAKSGTVLRIDISGKPLGDLPKKTLQEIGLTNKRIQDFKSCVVLDGKLDPADE